MFDTTPKPFMLKGQRNEKFPGGVAGGLSELVDNSFGPGRGDGTEAHLSWDKHRRILEVLDNGRGMDNVGRIFQFGNTIGISLRDIGMYGSGGTKAILHIPRKVEVWTMRDGMVAHDKITWNSAVYTADHFPLINDEWRNSTSINTPEALYALGSSGTLIRMHVGTDRRINESNIRRDLGLNYAPAIRQGKKLTWNGEPIANPINFDELTQSVDFSLILEVAADDNGGVTDLSVRGKIGIVPDLPQSQSVIHVGYAYRTVERTRECFASPDGSERYTGVGVTGWLDLAEGWRPYLSTTKDEIHDKAAWDALMGHVFEKIKPLLKSISEEKQYIVLDNIAMSLSNALDGSVDIEVPSGRPDIPDLPDREGRISDGQRKPRKPTPGDETQAKDQSSARIEIVMLPDAEIESLLCKAVASNNGVDVFVNKDHDFVQRAVDRQPINQDALNLLVIGEVAPALLENWEVAKSVIPKSMLRVLDGKRDDPRQCEGLLTRMLIDNAVKAG